MPGARPDVAYNPDPTVSPETGAGNDMLNVRATPDDFGGETAQAIQGVGQTLGKVSDQVQDTVLRQQGMINETMATNGETQLALQHGAVMNDLRQKEGLDAAAALPGALEQITAARQNIAATMPNPAARRAFDMLAARREANAITDANSYAAGQIKQANINSAHATVQNAISSAGQIEVAQDDTRFNDSLHDIQFGVTRQLQARGYGDSSGMTQDPETGAVSFDETQPAGQAASQVYKQAMGEATSAAWENRFKVLADQNVLSAYGKYQQSRDQIPGDAQVKLDQFFTPKVRDAQASSTAQGVLGIVDQAHTAQYGAAPSKSLFDAISGQESGGNPNVGTSVDGAHGQMQITPATFAQYAQPGENIDNPKDNAAVGQRILSDYSARYNGDPARIAVAYFSGPGNVAPAGSPTPYLQDLKDGNGQSVSGYVSGVMARLGPNAGYQPPAPAPGTPPPQSPPISQADYYRTNYTEIGDLARTRAQIEHPDDPAYAETVVARTYQQINTVIKAQELRDRADSDLVHNALLPDPTTGQYPTTLAALTANPAVKDAWGRMQINNPIAAQGIQTHLLTALSREDPTAKEYGPGFADLLKRVGAPMTDPDRVYDPTPLMDLQKYGLTFKGYTALQDQIKLRETDHPFTLQQNAFLDGAKQQIMGGTGGMGDPKGKQQYSAFLNDVMPAIAAAQKNGITASQMFDPKDPNYVGKNLSNFVRPMSQWYADTMNAGPAAATTAPTSAPIARAPQPPQGVPAGAMYSPSRNQWRASTGVIYGPDGKPVSDASKPTVPMAQ
jgi:hypothetical protein